MISKEETQHIAKLARLGLSESEIEKYQKDLSAILGYVDKLKSADIGEAAALAHSTAAENVLREDEAIPRPEQKTRRLREAFSEQKDGCLKVKAILWNLELKSGKNTTAFYILNYGVKKFNN